MNEIEIINNLRKIVKNTSSLNLQDDVFFDKKNSLIVSIDTYNENIHYLNFNFPNLIVKKVIRSSISDLISKGVDPRYLLIAFSGSNKHFNKKNIKLIINSIKQEQKKYNFSLAGGDTTKSNKSSFTVCSFGFSKRIIKRNNCSFNDDIYLTGNIGDSSVGLSLLENKFKTSNRIKKYFINEYYKPNIPFGFHRELFKFASSSMDISDGLLIDLKKLVDVNKLGFLINFDCLPKSKYFNKLIDQKKITVNNHLFNGDDYQILFTAKNKYRNTIIKSSIRCRQKITRIGNITNNNANYINFNDKLKKIKVYQGYMHNFN